MFELERERLVNKLIIDRYIKSDNVKEAFLRIPRELFVPTSLKMNAYLDTPLEIGNGQTISAPHMVAIMCEALDIKMGQKILEIGAGSGYHAAIVSQLVGKKGHVYTISGWVRGKNISPKALARLRLDFYITDGYALPRDKSYVAAEIGRFLEFGRKHNVPLYLGEFGCINVCFTEKRGGLEWVSDVVDICLAHNIHVNYHTYHEIYFGLYLNPPYKPANDQVLNKELAALFAEKFSR